MPVFTNTRNTFTRTEKAEMVAGRRVDDIDVEIGDIKQDDFLPQVKLKRWENEVNLSVRLMGDIADGDHSEKDGVIEWEKGDTKARFYHHDILDGGFEFEVEFAKKPVSNVVEFSIETKGLNFYYQPEETREGYTRPENVVGSYAVYHATQKGDRSRLGGKNYRAGKAYHIYRPKIIDANGVEVWGDLNINIEQKRLTVTVPQDFLDNAVYPVLVDPTFGYTSIGGSNSFWAGGTIGSDGEDYSPGSNGLLTSMSMYCQAFSTDKTLGVALYDDDDNLIDNNNATINTTLEWKTINMNSVPVFAATTYHLAFQVNDFITRYYDSGGSNGSIQDSQTFETWPDPITWDSPGASDIFSHYATFEPAVFPSVLSLSANLQSVTELVAKAASVFSLVVDHPNLAPIKTYETTTKPLQHTPHGKQKKIIFKVYGRDGTELISSEDGWHFDEIIREVNGSMYVRITTDILTKNVGQGITNMMNTVKIIVSSGESGSGGIVYFSGYIPKRTLNLRVTQEYVVIEALGHASRLWETVYRDGTTVKMDFTGASTAKASEIASDVIDKVQALDSSWPVDEATGSIEDSTDDIQDIFNLVAAGDVLQRCVFLAFDTDRIWHWLVKGDDVLYFKKNSTAADHSFTFAYDVSEFPDLSEELMQAKNEVFVIYNSGAAVERQANSDSITAYGNRSRVVTENNVPDATTATEIAQAYLAQLLPPLRSVRVIVNDTYAGGIENIDPGDTCKIKNLPTEIASILNSNMFITKTIYKKDHVILELSLQHPQVGSQVEQIRRRLAQQETDSLTATDYS